MPISISGDGTITGVSVGGLPNGIVDTDMLATSAVATAKIANDAVDATKIGSNTFVSYAMICDLKSTATQDGGTFTSGDWRTRDLNTEISDADGIVSISSNQFTLGAGSYLIRWSAPAFGVSKHAARLYDITADANIHNGSVERCNTSYLHTNRSHGAARVTITADNVYEIQHRCSTTRTVNGLGPATDFAPNVYAIVEIFKEA